MKINDYTVDIIDNNSGKLYAIKDGKKMFVQDMDLTDLDSSQVHDKALVLLESAGMTIVEPSEDVANILNDQKADLEYARTYMRKILRALGNDSMTNDEKVKMVGVYSTMCDAAANITKSCVVELAILKAKNKL